LGTIDLVLPTNPRTHQPPPVRALISTVLGDAADVGTGPRSTLGAVGTIAGRNDPDAA
jgi:hypothetical protein